jgi:hypothetical protein
MTTTYSGNWRSEGKITDVMDRDDGFFQISTDRSTGFMFEKSFGIVPRIGDTVEMRGELGARIGGIRIAGKVVYNKSDEQLAEEHRNFCENQERENRAKFEREREDMDRRYAALPEVFRRRIDKFRANNPDFRWEYEGYELFCCEEAVKIATALKMPEAIEKFSKLSWEGQRGLVDISTDHSGNTFGCAVKLAYYYLANPENVVKMYGALAPLVGSEEYGCVPKGKKD